MKKNPKKKITIESLATVVNNLAVKVDKGFKNVHSEMENLAIMVGRGFEAVDKRFDGVDERIDKVETRLDKVESKLGQVEYRLMTVEDNQLDLKLRMDVLSQNNKGTDELRSRVVVLEKKVGVKGR